MAWRPHGRATVDPTAPSAQAVCDRCGLLYSLKDLAHEMQWRGNRLMWTGFLVCRQTCLDRPQEQLRPRILPADPIPVVNPRIEHYLEEDGTQPYVGPGDIVPSSVGWYGLRGYSYAYALPATNPAMLLRRPSDNSTKVVNILASGQFDWPTAWNFCSGGPVYVVTMYDQTGHGLDVTQPCPELQPLLLFNGLNGSPVLDMNGAQWLIAASPAAVTQNNMTLSAVFLGRQSTGLSPLYGPNILLEPVIGGSADMAIFTAYPVFGSNSGLNYGSGPLGILAADEETTAVVYGGNTIWYGVQATANGNSSILNINGSTYPNIPGNSDAPTPFAIGYGLPSFVGGPPQFEGQFAEGGVWPSVFSSAQCATLYENQRAFWGLNIPYGPSPPAPAIDWATYDDGTWLTDGGTPWSTE